MNTCIADLMIKSNEANQELNRTSHEISIHSDFLVKKKNLIIARKQEEIEHLQGEIEQLQQESKESLLFLMNYLESIKNIPDLAQLQGKLGYLIRQTRLDLGV